MNKVKYVLGISLLLLVSMIPLTSAWNYDVGLSEGDEIIYRTDINGTALNHTQYSKILITEIEDVSTIGTNITYNQSSAIVLGTWENETTGDFYLNSSADIATNMFQANASNFIPKGYKIGDHSTEFETAFKEQNPGYDNVTTESLSDGYGIKITFNVTMINIYTFTSVNEMTFLFNDDGILTSSNSTSITYMSGENIGNFAISILALEINKASSGIPGYPGIILGTVLGFSIFVIIKKKNSSINEK